MAHVRGLEFFHLENREELVFTEFEERVAFAAVQFFEIENVFVKRDGLPDVIHLDRDMIASVNLHAHFPIYIVPGRTKAGGTRCVVSVKRGRPHFANVLTKIAYSARNLFCWAFVGNYWLFVAMEKPAEVYQKSVIEMDRIWVAAQFEALLPLAAEWVIEMERQILSEGVPLSEKEIVDATGAGVQQPGRVRLLRVDSIPTPIHPQLKAAAEVIAFLTPATRGLTLQYGIFIRSDCWRDRALIVHELVHTAQYERLGGILPFLRKYLFECITTGYPESPMEQEAITLVARICRE